MSETRTDANLTLGGRPAPAHNTTSDAPVVTPAPVPDHPAPTPAPTPAAAPTSTPSPEPTPSPPPPAEPRSRSEIQARFSEMAAQRREAEARAAEAEAARAKLQETLDRVLPIVERAEQSQQPTPTPPTEGRPDRTTFETPEAYEDALISWSSSRAAEAAVKKASEDFERLLSEQREKDAQTAREQAAAQAQAQIASDFLSRCDKFKETTPDFDYQEISSRPAAQMPVSEFMANAIWQDDNGPAIVHHLGQKPEEARRIFQLPPVRQIVEIGRLSATLNAAPASSPIPPPPQPPSGGLPPPIAPDIVGGGSSGAPTGAEPSMEEWAAKRNNEFAAERRASTLGLPRPH